MSNKALVAMAVLGAFVLGVVLGSTASEEPTTSEPTAASDTTLAGAPDTTAAPETTTTAAPRTTAAKQWVEVTRLSGAAQKRGPLFRLSGDQARMRYKAAGGVFFVYIVEEGKRTEEHGGFAEVSCMDACADETRLAKRAGNYYLEVTGRENWVVIIEEMR